MLKKISFFVIICFILSLTACNNKTNSDLKYGNYTYENEDKTKSQIILKDNYIKFKDVDFSDTYLTLAQVSVSKELGSSLNNFTQEEIQEKINNVSNELINKSILKNNTEYTYNYDEQNHLININSNNINIILENVKLNKKDCLKLYHLEFYK